MRTIEKLFGRKSLKFKDSIEAITLNTDLTFIQCMRRIVDVLHASQKSGWGSPTPWEKHDRHMQELATAIIGYKARVRGMSLTQTMKWLGVTKDELSNEGKTISVKQLEAALDPFLKFKYNRVQASDGEEEGSQAYQELYNALFESFQDLSGNTSASLVSTVKSLADVLNKHYRPHRDYIREQASLAHMENTFLEITPARQQEEEALALSARAKAEAWEPNYKDLLTLVPSYFHSRVTFLQQESAQRANATSLKCLRRTVANPYVSITLGYTGATYNFTGLSANEYTPKHPEWKELVNFVRKIPIDNLVEEGGKLTCDPPHHLSVMTRYLSLVKTHLERIDNIRTQEGESNVEALYEVFKQQKDTLLAVQQKREDSDPVREVAAKKTAVPATLVDLCSKPPDADFQYKAFESERDAALDMFKDKKGLEYVQTYYKLCAMASQLGKSKPHPVAFFDNMKQYTELYYKVEAKRLLDQHSPQYKFIEYARVDSAVKSDHEIPKELEEHITKFSYAWQDANNLLGGRFMINDALKLPQALVKLATADDDASVFSTDARSCIQSFKAAYLRLYQSSTADISKRIDAFRHYTECFRLEYRLLPDAAGHKTALARFHATRSQDQLRQDEGPSDGESMLANHEEIIKAPIKAIRDEIGLKMNMCVDTHLLDDIIWILPVIESLYKIPKSEIDDKEFQGIISPLLVKVKQFSFPDRLSTRYRHKNREKLKTLCDLLDRARTGMDDRQKDAAYMAFLATKHRELYEKFVKPEEDDQNKRTIEILNREIKRYIKSTTARFFGRLYPTRENRYRKIVELLGVINGQGLPGDSSDKDKLKELASKPESLFTDDIVLTPEKIQKIIKIRDDVLQDHMKHRNNMGCGAGFFWAIGTKSHLVCILDKALRAYGQKVTSSSKPILKESGNPFCTEVPPADEPNSSSNHSNGPSGAYSR